MGLRRRKKPGKSLMAFAWYTGGSMSVPVTKFSLRMYGSRKGVEREQARQEKAGSFVIHPYSNFRFYWDFVSLVLLIISMIVIPVAITFFNEKMTSDPGWMAFNLVLDFWFLSDIIINFHTGIIVEYGDGDVVLNLRRIRQNYLRSWFIVDLVSTLPVDYILQLLNGVSASASASRAMKLFRFAKMLSLLRLLRISRLIRYVHQWEEIVNMQYDLAVAAVRIFNLVCLMLLIGHWNGCLQYLIPMLYDFPKDSWIIVDNLQNASWGEKYSWSLFKAMSHMLCIGYGQQPPKTLMDLWMTMISMVSGAVCFAMFIGHTTALIQSLDSSKRQYKEKVKEYMRYRRLPKSLRMRVYDYYENRFQGKMFDEQGILAEISPTLQEEIVNYNCRHLVASVPFFRNADQEFVSEVVQKLKYEVFQPNDVIVKEGSVGKKMYVMQHGVVEIRNTENTNTTQLSDGSYFGEICLLTNQRRVASVVAITNCCLYSLHADDFNELLPRYPVMKRTLETVAASRLSKLGRFSSVLERRARQQQSYDPTSTEIAQEIQKHDEMQVKTPNQQSFSGNRIQNFRQNNINSPNKKYQAYFRTHCVESETAPLRSHIQVRSDRPYSVNSTGSKNSDHSSSSDTRRRHHRKRTKAIIKRFFQYGDGECSDYVRSPSHTSGYITNDSRQIMETNFMANKFAENGEDINTFYSKTSSNGVHSVHFYQLDNLRSSPDGEMAPDLPCSISKPNNKLTCEVELETNGELTKISSVDSVISSNLAENVSLSKVTHPSNSSTASECDVVLGKRLSTSHVSLLDINARRTATNNLSHTTSLPSIRDPYFTDRYSKNLRTTSLRTLKSVSKQYITKGDEKRKSLSFRYSPI